MGDRTEHERRLAGLAERGIAVASVDYRTADLASFPAQREDLEAAAAWVATKTGEREVDRPVALMGASAGAHLAAMTVLTSSFPFFAFVGLFGRYDLTAAGSVPAPSRHLSVPEAIRAARPPAGFEYLDHHGRIALLAGVDPDRLDETVLRRISPLHRIRPGAPPMLLAHGTGDAVIHHRQSERLHAAAQAAGVRSELLLVPGANHEDALFESPDVLTRIAEFLYATQNSEERL